MAKNKGAAAPGIGHNAALTDDEKRALTLHHKRAYEAADALVEKAKADRTAIADLAKSILASAFKKKRPVDPPAADPSQVDLEQAIADKAA